MNEIKIIEGAICVDVPPFDEKNTDAILIHLQIRDQLTNVLYRSQFSNAGYAAEYVKNITQGAILSRIDGYGFSDDTDLDVLYASAKGKTKKALERFRPFWTEAKEAGCSENIAGSLLKYIDSFNAEFAKGEMKFRLEIFGLTQ